MAERDYEMYSRMHDLISIEYKDVSLEDKYYALTLLLIQAAASLGETPESMHRNISALYSEVTRTLQQQEQDVLS